LLFTGIDRPYEIRNLLSDGLSDPTSSKRWESKLKTLAATPSHTDWLDEVATATGSMSKAGSAKYYRFRSRELAKSLQKN